MQLHNKSEHKIYGGQGKSFKHFEGGNLLGDDIEEDVGTKRKQKSFQMAEVNYCLNIIYFKKKEFNLIIQNTC